MTVSLRSLAKLLAPIVFGLITYVLPWLIWGAPSPEGLSPKAWLYFSIFFGLAVGLVLEPIPPAFLGLIAVVLSVLFKVGPAGSGQMDKVVSSAAAINWGISGFSNAVVWLIFAAFTIGIGFSKTGLGRRIALWIVSKLGKSTLGLGYSIAIVDGILAPFIPSNAARSGGTVYPIVTNIAPMFDSLPDKNPRRIGAYLIWVGLASSCVTSSIFLTGQAPNPLALTLISKSGVAVPDWFGWFLANLPIGILLFILTPLMAFWFYPPEIKGSQEIAQWARGEYEKLGSMSKEQIYMVIIALLGLTLWIGSSAFKINATTTALLMIVLMVATRVIEWKDFLHNTTAWNTLVWFATLVAMADGLKNVGFLSWLATSFGNTLSGMSSTMAVLVLLVLFCLLRYFFASGTAYVTATMVIFVTIAQAIPGIDIAKTMLLLCLPMGFMGVITPYGTGCSPLFFGSRYIPGPRFFLLGAIFGAIYLAAYMLIGIPWLNFIYPHITMG